MRILVFDPNAASGHHNYTKGLLTAVCAAGGVSVNVCLVTRQPTRPLTWPASFRVEALLPPLVPSIDLSLAAWVSTRVREQLRDARIFREFIATSGPFEIVHFLQSYPSWLGPGLFRCAKKQGAGVVETVHNVCPHGRRGTTTRRAEELFDRRAWRRVDGLIVHTRTLATALRESLGEPTPTIHVVPHGVPERAGPIEWPSCSARQLLFFGVLRRNKGLEILIRAMAELPEYRLTIAGSTPDRQYQEHLEKLCAEIGRGGITFLGRHVSDGQAADLFRGASAVVLPYVQFESQSGVLHDALAYGRPVVATTVGGLGEVVAETGVGVTVEPGDARQLARGIRSLHSEAPYQDAVKAVFREREERSWRRIADKVLAVYECHATLRSQDV